jgi:hypothetical protein
MINVRAVWTSFIVDLLPGVQMIIGPVLGLAPTANTGVRRGGASGVSDPHVSAAIGDAVTAPTGIEVACLGRHDVFGVAVFLDPS